MSEETPKKEPHYVDLGSLVATGRAKPEHRPPMQLVPQQEQPQETPSPQPDGPVATPQQNLEAVLDEQGVPDVGGGAPTPEQMAEIDGLVEAAAATEPAAPTMTEHDGLRRGVLPRDIAGALISMFEAEGFRALEGVDFAVKPFYDPNGLRGAQGEPLTQLGRIAKVTLYWQPTKLERHVERVRKCIKELRRMGVQIDEKTAGLAPEK